MSDIKDRAREYLVKHSEYSEVFDQTFIAVDTLTAMVDFAEQENEKLNNRCKKYEQQISAMESGICTVCSEVDKELQIEELQEENKNLSDNYELYKATAEPTIKELKEQIENLKIMLQAEREVRCNDEYLKKVTELETYNEKLLNGDIEKHNKIVSLEAQIEKMKMDKCKLTSEIKRLSIQYAEETDEIVKQLETQIEKMKCCANCKHSRTEYEHCRTDKHEKWEMQ